MAGLDTPAVERMDLPEINNRPKAASLWVPKTYCAD